MPIVVTLCFLLLALFSGGSAQTEPHEGATDTVVRRTGVDVLVREGQEDASDRPALRLSWMHAGSLVLGVSGGNDVERVWCHDGRYAWLRSPTPGAAGDNGTTPSNQDTLAWHEGTCSARAEGATLILRLRDEDDGNHTGTFVGSDDAVFLADGGWYERPQEPAAWPGLVITGLATLFFIGFVSGLYLFVQERRLSRYMVRRLYEETKGNMPKDWPPGLHHQWVARAFVRGKN